MRCPQSFLALACIFAVTAGSSAVAGDGVLEINQACALVGCSPGDAPGFPVFVTEPGSYKLTGNLDLTATPGTTAVQIAAPFVTLDLNGFEIVGPTECTGSGSTLNCSGGDGSAVLIEADSRAVVVRNGTVRNMGAYGIWGFSDGLTIETVRAINNARDGLRGESDSIVTRSMAIENGEDGFDFNSGSVLRNNTASGNGNDGIEIDGPGGVVSESTSRVNGNRGFNLAYSSRFRSNVSRDNSTADSCGGGICTSSRRYYLTATEHDGSQVLAACAAGFDVASIWELLDVSNLAYDRILGESSISTGNGPPSSITSEGWARPGGCSNWSSSNGGDTGSVHILSGFVMVNDPASYISPWLQGRANCNTFHKVWCIEQ